MGKNITAELERLGRSAVQKVAGKGVVKDVEVEAGEDLSGRPAYHFSFLIEPGHANVGAGLLRTRLIQKLRDELIARGDGHYPVIRMLSPSDWNRRKDAQSH